MFTKRDIAFKIGLAFTVLATAFLITIALVIAAVKSASDTSYELCDEYISLAQRTQTENTRKVQNIYKQSVAKQKTLLYLVVVFTSLDGILIFVVYRATVKEIQAPVYELKQATDELMNGNFNVDISYSSEDDIGDLANNIRQVTATLGNYVRDIEEFMAQMSQGNLDIGLTENFKGDFLSIKNSTDNMIIAFNDIIRRVSFESREIIAISDRIQTTLESISNGSENQADNMQELSETVSELSQSLDDASQRADGAGEEIQELVSQARLGGESARELGENIKAVNNNSDQIKNIIKIIEGIALKADLLSVNASVEAMKAGDFGGDFALIADEIKQLSKKILNEAGYIKQLIEKNDLTLKEGAELSDKTEQIFTKLTDCSDTCAGEIKEISQELNRYSSKMNLIKTGADTIGFSVRSNSAAAEKSSNFSRIAAQRAEKINDLVSDFNLRRR